MFNLKTIQDMVKTVLISDADTRDDDMKLYLSVCDYCLPKVNMLPFERVMKEYRSLGIPCFESVRRTRQKLQADYPELSGTRRTKELRATQEKIYRQYAKS